MKPVENLSKQKNAFGKNREREPAVQNPRRYQAASGDRKSENNGCRRKAKTAAQLIELVGYFWEMKKIAIEINKVQDINEIMEIARVPKARFRGRGDEPSASSYIHIHLRKRSDVP